MFYLIFAICWVLLFGFTCASLAGKKNLDPAMWFFVGAILGIIGVVLILILPAGASRGNRHAPSRGCPYCGAKFSTSFSVCPECSRKLPDFGTASNTSWERTVAATAEVAKWTKDHKTE